MNSAKGQRAEGTDGSDHASRHVIEDRYAAAATARSALSNYSLALMYVYGSWALYLILHQLYTGISTLSTKHVEWVCLALNSVILYIGRQTRNGANITTWKSLNYVSVLLHAAATVWEFYSPPPDYLILVFIMISMVCCFSLNIFIGMVNANSVKTAKKK